MYSPVCSLAYTPVYINSDGSDRLFPEVSLVVDTAALAGRDITLTLPTGLNWASGNSADTTMSADTTISTGLLRVTNNGLDTVDSLTYSFDGPGGTFKMTNGLVVTGFDSINFDKRDYISGDDRSIGTSSIKLHSPGFYPDHTLYVDLPDVFSWSPSPLIGTINNEDNSILEISFSNNGGATVDISDLVVLVDGDTTYSGAISVALLYKDEIYITSQDTQDSSSYSLLVDDPQFSLSYDPVYLVGDDSTRSFPGIMVQTIHPEVLSGRRLTATLPSGLAWAGNDYLDLGNYTATDTIDTLGFPLVSTISDTGVSPLVLSFDAGNTQSRTSSNAITVGTLADVDYRNNWIVGDGVRNVEINSLEFSHSPFKEGYYVYLHLPAGGPTFSSIPALDPSLGDGELQNGSSVIKWGPISQNISASILTITDSLQVVMPEDSGPYAIGVSVLRNPTYQAQLSLSEEINVYDLSIQLSQDIVLLSNHGSDSAQYGGYLTISAIGADHINNPFYDDRQLTVTFKDSLANYAVHNDTTLLIDSLNSVPAFTIDPLLFHNTLDSHIQMPYNISLAVDTNSSTWLSDNTIRTTTLLVIPLDSMSTNFIIGDLNFPLPPFAVKQDPQVPSLIPGYNLVLSVDKDIIVSSTVNIISDSINYYFSSDSDSVVFSVDGNPDTEFEIHGLILKEAIDNVVRWHFVADSMLVAGGFAVALDTSDVKVAKPSFYSLALPDSTYDLDNFYRPVYFVGDTIPRPYPPIIIKDDGNTRCLANRKCTIKLPDSLVWVNFDSTNIHDSITVTIMPANPNILEIDFRNYQTGDFETLQINELFVKGFNDVETIEDTLEIRIDNNDNHWEHIDSLHAFQDNFWINVYDPMNISFLETHAKASQVLWIDTLLDTLLDSLPKWHIDTLYLSDPTQLFSERDIYFRSKTDTNFAFADTTTSLSIRSGKDYSTIEPDSLNPITVKQIFKADTSLQFCITGDPKIINPYWIDCKSLVFRAVDPEFTIPAGSRRVWLVDDENESITLNITTDYGIAFKEHPPIFYLPDSFPTSLKTNDQKNIKVDWTTANTDSLINYGLNLINNVMNWDSCGIKCPQIALLDPSSNISHAERYDSVKVGTFSAINIGSIVSTINDPLTILDTIDINLGWDNDNPQGSPVQPLMALDTIFFQLVNSENLTLNAIGIDIISVSISEKVSLLNHTVTNNILKIPVIIDFEDSDNLLQLTGLGIDSPTQRSNSKMDLNISLRPFPADTTIHDHRQVTVADLTIGRPIVTRNPTIYSDNIPGHSLTLKEDAKWITLHRSIGSVVDDNLDERILVLTILNSDTSVHWNTIRGFIPTSGQYSTFWQDLNHRPKFENNKTKYYSLVNSDHDPDSSATIYPFNDLIIGDNFSDNSLIIGIGTNKSTYFQTLEYHIIDPPVAEFENGNNLAFLASDSGFTISGFTVYSDSIGSIRIVISDNLSCVWDSTAFVSVDTGYSFSADGKILSKILPTGTTTRSDPDTIFTMDNLWFKTIQPALSYSAPLRITINDNKTIYSAQNITLGNPSSTLGYSITYIEEFDTNTVLLPPVTIKQDMDLLAMIQKRLLGESDNIFLSIPTSQIKFDTSTDRIDTKIHINSVETDTFISILAVSDSCIILDPIRTPYNSLTFNNIRLIVDATQEWENDLVNLSFGIVKGSKNSSMGHVARPLNFGNLVLTGKSNHISLFGPDNRLNLGDIEFTVNDNVLFKTGQEIRISAFITLSGKTIFLDWDDTSIGKGRFKKLSLGKNKNARLELDSLHNESISLSSLTPGINLEELLKDTTFSIDSFPCPVTIKIDLISDTGNVHFSAATVSFLIDEADMFHLPVFSSPPVVNNNGITFNMIKGLFETDSTDLIFNLAVAGDDMTWPHFDTVIVNSNGQNLMAHASNDKKNVSKLKKDIELSKFKSKPSRVTEKIYSRSKLVQPAISVENSTAVDLVNKYKLVDKLATNNQVTVSLQWEDSTIFAFNEQLFNYISQQHDTTFTIMLNRNGISSPDSYLADTSIALNWDITSINFRKNRNPLVDFAEVSGQIFNSSYVFTLNDITTDDSVKIQEITNDSTGINTTITLNLLESFTTDSLKEGLYTIKIEPDSTFPIYRQIIKDTTSPDIITLSPQAVNNALTILNSDSDSTNADAGTDTITIQFTENFFVNHEGDSIIYQIVSQNPDTIDALTLKTPFKNPPKNRFQFSVYQDTLYSDSTDELSQGRNFISGFNQILPKDLEGSFMLVIRILDAAGNESEPDTVFFNAMLANGAEGDISDKIFNYPNPFSAGATTTFRYVLGKEVTKGQLAIFDAAGDIVYYWDLVKSGKNSGGTQEIRWDGRNLFGDKLSTGVYFGYFEVNYSGGKKGERSFLKIAINNQ